MTAGRCVVLGVETATAVGGAAVVEVREGTIQLVAELRIGAGQYAERLMGVIDHVLRQAGLTVHALDGFAFSSGPGSFTGLRIGLATVKGLAQATGRPVLPVPTLEAMAMTAPAGTSLICPMLDARQQEVFAAIFRYGMAGRLERLMPETAAPPQEVLVQLTGDTVFLGDGAERYHEQIRRALGDRALFSRPLTDLPLPAAVARCGLARLLDGEGCSPSEATLLYLRRSGAELARERGRA